MPTSTNADDIATRLDKLNTELKSAQDLMAGWTRGGGTIPNFEFMRATNADFVVPPLETAHFRLTSPIAVTATWNNVPFDTVDWNNGPWEFTTGQSSFTHYRPPLAESYWFFGWAQFSTNSSGAVGVRFVREGFVNGAPSTQTDVISAMSVVQGAPPGIGNVIPFSYPLRANSSATGFRFQVFQNGAASTTFQAMSLGIIRVARL